MSAFQTTSTTSATPNPRTATTPLTASGATKLLAVLRVYILLGNESFHDAIIYTSIAYYKATPTSPIELDSVVNSPIYILKNITCLQLKYNICLNDSLLGFIKRRPLALRAFPRYVGTLQCGTTLILFKILTE